MSNVFQFPKAPKPPRLALDLRRVMEALRVPAGFVGALTWLRSAVRGLLFLLLYWMRGPVHAVCSLIAGPALLCFLAGLWFAHQAPKYQPMVWGLGVASFAAFAVRYAYDSLLLRLAPPDQIFLL